MISRQQLCKYLDDLLQPQLFKDYCPNGLQVQGRDDIAKVVMGVSANQALIEAAIVQQADTVIVHHGFFWKGEDPCLVGIKRKRIAALLENNINLFAYHLPLDANKKCGNNVELAKLLDIKYKGEFSCGEQPPLGCYGEFPSALTGEQLTQWIQQQLSQQPIYIAGEATEIKTVGWCTGAAQDFIEAAALQNLDAFITGEVSERTVAIAKEYGIHFYAAGHHATERGGVKALGELISNKFKLDCQFIDIDNPV
ncbi:MAG: Nif3-like dinuclear metal center hexameric protein [Gammaproteobacteria bacterium]|nr:Nif3-like dinuclear metal center hexameric protein [Gammaproteobacteria bacterium]MCH9745038.1 Nif3-like dinuclear metal center hexameric protein [Gammaproteobacteria bacterium]